MAASGSTPRSTSTLQQQAYDSVYGFLDQPDDPAGALVSVDDVGRVVAMVGGQNFDTSQVDLALGAAAGGSGRQPGSSFKPIVLATALGQDISARSQFENLNQITFPKANDGKDWKVSNYSNGAEGPIDLVQATRISSNTVYSQLMLEVGPANVVNEAEKLGIRDTAPRRELARAGRRRGVGPRHGHRLLDLRPAGPARRARSSSPRSNKSSTVR